LEEYPGSKSCFDFVEDAEESLLSLLLSLPLPRLFPFPLPSNCLGGVALRGDDAPDVVADGLPNSLSLTSSYFRCFSSRFFRAMACRSSGVGSGRFWSSSESSRLSLVAKPSRLMPAVAEETPLDDDWRVIN
jgi:hypothetical protein